MIFKEIQTFFKYCPNCKNEVIVNGNNIHCDKCGFDYYLTPNPSTGIIIVNNKNQIYLAKRSIEPGAGSFDLPGGFISFHEKAEDTIKREIKEEMDLDLKEVKLFATYSGDYKLKGTQYYPLDIYFVAYVDIDYIDISNAQDKELEEGRFFNIDEIPFEGLAFKTQKFALRDFIDSLKK